jgi:hypothetical protein
MHNSSLFGSRSSLLLNSCLLLLSCMKRFPVRTFRRRWQYVSICKKHDSRGFSTDVTGILIIANITRLFYWIGARFQTYLLVQSILMIVTQYGLLYVCVLYRPANWRATLPPRPGNFWQWASFGTFLEATAILIVGHAVLFLILHKVDLYVQVLGFVALGLEATVRFVCKVWPAESISQKLTSPSGRTASDPASDCQLPRQVDGRVPALSPRKLGHRRESYTAVLP